MSRDTDSDEVPRDKKMIATRGCTPNNTGHWERRVEPRATKAHHPDDSGEQAEDEPDDERTMRRGEEQCAKSHT